MNWVEEEEQKQRDHLREDIKIAEIRDDGSLDQGGNNGDCKNDKSLDIL